MIKRNSRVVEISRNALTAIGLRGLGRRVLSAAENLFYGSKTRIRVGDVQGTFSLSEPTLRHYLGEYGKSKRGRLETFVLDFVISKVGPGMCFYDVGAFCGLYSVLAAKKIGDTGVVHAFELIEDNFIHLRNNLKLNNVNNAHGHLCAVQDVSTLISFPQHGSQTDTAHSLIDIRSHLNTQRATIDAVVSAITLDDFASVSGRTPDVMKIDVEGAEMRVLRGAKRVLAECSVVVCELHPKALKADGYTTEDVLSLLQAAGFRLSKVEGFRQDEGQELISIEPSAPIERNSMILAIRDHQIGSQLRVVSEVSRAV